MSGSQRRRHQAASENADEPGDNHFRTSFPSSSSSPPLFSLFGNTFILISPTDIRIEPEVEKTMGILLPRWDQEEEACSALGAWDLVSAFGSMFSQSSKAIFSICSLFPRRRQPRPAQGRSAPTLTVSLNSDFCFSSDETIVIFARQSDG